MYGLPYQRCVSVIKSRKWNKKNQQMEPMYVAREKGNNILSYVDFSKICYVMKSFPELKPNFGKEDINFPLSPSSRAAE